MSNRVWTWFATTMLCIGALFFDMSLIDPFYHPTFDFFLYFAVGTINFAALLCFVVVVSREVIRQTFNAIATEKWLNDFSNKGVNE